MYVYMEARLEGVKATHGAVVVEGGMMTAMYTVSPHPDSGGRRRSPTLFTARQHPDVGFLCMYTYIRELNRGRARDITIYLHNCFHHLGRQT